MTNQPPAFSSTFMNWIELFMHRSMRSLVRYARQRGLSMSQMATLFQISRGGQMAVSDIGGDLGVSNAAASQLLDRLVQQGLVLRSENPQDRREKMLVLTDEGRQVLLETAHTRQAWLELLVDTLTPEEKAKIVEALEILTDHTNRLPDEN